MGERRILISVVMPSYNRVNLIGRAIDSICSQIVDADIELLIGDNASTEDTKSVYEQYMQKYPNMIRVYYRPEDIGIGANWASLVLACKGKYVCNCDNDDFWHNPHKLQMQLEYMESHPDANVVFTDYRTLYCKTGKETENRMRKTGDTKEELQQDILHGMHKNSYHISTIMFRRDFVFANVPLKDFVDRRLPMQDWPFFILLSEKTNFDILQESTATFCIHGDSYTHKQDYKQLENRLRRDSLNMQYLYEKLPHLGVYDEGEWQDYMYYRLLSMAYANSDFIKAKQYVQKTKYINLKTKCAKNWMSFKLYALLSKLKRKMKGM